MRHQNQHLLLVLLLPGCLNGSDVVTVLFDVASEASEDHRLAAFTLISFTLFFAFFSHLFPG